MAGEAGESGVESRGWRRHLSPILVGAAFGVGLYELGWGTDPQWGWNLILIATGALIFMVVWRLPVHLIVKAVVVVVTLTAGLYLVSDPFLAVARARILTHRSEMEAIGDRTLAAATPGVFTGTHGPVDPITRLAGTDVEAAAPAVPRLANESVAYGAVLGDPDRRALFCLDLDCAVVLVYAPHGPPPPPPPCPDGRRGELDALVGAWYRLLPVAC